MTSIAKNLKRLSLLFMLLVVFSCSSEDVDIIEEEDTTDEEMTGGDGGDTDNTTDGTVNTFGKLKVNGNQIVSEKTGEVVQLRGMSLFWSQWEGEFYNADAIKWLVEDWNINVVRAALGVEVAQDNGIVVGYLANNGANKEIEKAKIFAVIDAAIEEDIYVIVDWHSHKAENELEDAIEFFEEVAQKYGDFPNIIYETYNEPIDGNWVNVLKPYHEAVIDKIREYDEDNLVVCGTRTFSQRVDEVIDNEIDDDNVAYTLHYYSSSPAHQEPLRAIAQTAIDANLALFVTEFGVSEFTGDGNIDNGQADIWWDFLEENNISWCNWSIADKNESSASLKEGVSSTGGWSTNDLSESGILVRNKLLSY